MVIASSITEIQNFKYRDQILEVYGKENCRYRPHAAAASKGETAEGMQPDNRVLSVGPGIFIRLATTCCQGSKVK